MTVSPYPGDPLAQFLRTQHWACERAGQFFWNLPQEVTPDQALRALAAAGFFPTPAQFRTWAAESSGQSSNGLEPGSPIKGFEKRAYQIRTAELADLPALLALEEACWSDGLRAHADELVSRIIGYPQGQLALEREGQVVGAIYSQRIVDVSALLQSNFRDVAALHDPAGPIAQPLAVNVLPSMQQYGLGDQLLEFLLQLSTLNPTVERVAAVTLCKAYPQQSGLPMEEYIHQRNSYGLPVDPILAFHVAHGAQIRRTIDGYRPPDHANLGKGVLVEYDLRSRLAARSAAAEPAAPLDRSALSAKVEAAVRQVMPLQHAAVFSIRRPLRELGFSSLELLELAQLLSQQLNTELDANFFSATAAWKRSSAFLSRESGKQPPPQRRPRPTAPRRPSPMRWRSSAWPAVFRAGSIRPLHSGSSWPLDGTRSGRCQPHAGRSTLSTATSPARS